MLPCYERQHGQGVIRVSLRCLSGQCVTFAGQADNASRTNAALASDTDCSGIWRVGVVSLLTFFFFFWELLVAWVKKPARHDNGCVALTTQWDWWEDSEPNRDLAPEMFINITSACELSGRWFLNVFFWLNPSQRSVYCSQLSIDTSIRMKDNKTMHTKVVKNSPKTRFTV